ncbi:MAG TPA: hypothetical protein VMU19_03150 [Bryobacteraceae bacterium]|nr:hypothetical protein [Bryobacteraceae bacterium]
MAGNSHNRQDAPMPGATHEERDINVMAVSGLALFLVVLCVGSTILLIGLFKYFTARENARQVPVEHAVEMPGTIPQPKLQVHEHDDLLKFRAEEDQILTSYGWVDRDKGIVRIPIDRAIDLLAQRNLPHRDAAAPESAAAGVTVPTESGLGQKMIVPGGPLAEEKGK